MKIPFPPEVIPVTIDTSVRSNITYHKNVTFVHAVWYCPQCKKRQVTSIAAIEETGKHLSSAMCSSCMNEVKLKLTIL